MDPNSIDNFRFSLESGKKVCHTYNNNPEKVNKM